MHLYSCRAVYFPVSSVAVLKVVMHRAGEMAQSLPVHAALAEGLSSQPSH